MHWFEKDDKYDCSAIQRVIQVFLNLNSEQL